MAPVWQDFLRGERTQFLYRITLCSNAKYSQASSRVMVDLYRCYIYDSICTLPCFLRILYNEKAQFILDSSFSSILPRNVLCTTISRNSIYACTLFHTRKLFPNLEYSYHYQSAQDTRGKIELALLVEIGSRGDLVELGLQPALLKLNIFCTIVNYYTE